VTECVVLFSHIRWLDENGHAGQVAEQGETVDLHDDQYAVKEALGAVGDPDEESGGGKPPVGPPKPVQH
jgi:hypothetical protein